MRRAVPLDTVRRAVSASPTRSSNKCGLIAVHESRSWHQLGMPSQSSDACYWGMNRPSSAPSNRPKCDKYKQRARRAFDRRTLLTTSAVRQSFGDLGGRAWVGAAAGVIVQLSREEVCVRHGARAARSGRTQIVGDIGRRRGRILAADGARRGRHRPHPARTPRRIRCAGREAWRTHRQDHRRRRAAGVSLGGRCGRMRGRSAGGDGRAQRRRPSKTVVCCSGSGSILETF